MDREQTKRQSVLTYLYRKKEQYSKKKIALAKQAEHINNMCRLNNRKLAVTEEKICAIENREITISSHAQQRFKERFWKADEEEIRKILLTPAVMKMIEVLGSNGRYPCEDLGAIVVLADRVVVTVLSSQADTH